MKIYLSHASGFNYEDELYKPLLTSELVQKHDITLPHLAGIDPNFIKDELSKYDLVLAEVSFPSIGQGIELGWANFLGLPIYCIARSGAKLSSSLKFVTDSLTYYEPPKMLEVITKILM